MDQKRSRSEEMPNRESSMEQAEGSRETVRNSGNAGTSRQSPSTAERGRGSGGERNRVDSGSSSSSSSDSSSNSSGSSKSGGITNRSLDREQCEQQQLPDRGESQSER